MTHYAWRIADARAAQGWAFASGDVTLAVRLTAAAVPL